MYLGLDFGSSGARACVIDESEAVVHEDRIEYHNAARQTPEDWRLALLTLIRNTPPVILSKLKRISIDATSSTVFLCDAALQPVSPVLLYNDARATTQAETIKSLAPAGHTVCSANSGLSKFLWLTQQVDLNKAEHFMHQADWLIALLVGHGGISDYHNALKTGYDVEHFCWPDWVCALPFASLLPDVLAPGSFIAEISPTIAQHFNINPACTIHAGTTDSIAAFIASNVKKPGEAVSSLGTTLALKLISTTRIEAPQFGVYSHRYGGYWLAGGASNTGGGVLRSFFSDAQLEALSHHIDASGDSNLDYYPLPCPGERFPINDTKLEPRLGPRPDDDVQFLHGLLQGVARIEAAGYAKLMALGATPLISVTSCGGGAKNLIWQQIRARLLGVPIRPAQHGEASFGTAILSKHGIAI